MTEENRRRNVQLELERAAESRREVEALMAAGLWAASVSRAYYGMFYLARALVFDLGLEAKNHSGIASLISLHLVRAGQFPAEQVRRYSQMQRVREDADYVTSIVMDESAAGEARHHLLEFREAVHRHLGGRGHQVP